MSRHRGRLRTLHVAATEWSVEQEELGRIERTGVRDRRVSKRGRARAGIGMLDQSLPSARARPDESVSASQLAPCGNVRVPLTSSLLETSFHQGGHAGALFVSLEPVTGS